MDYIIITKTLRTDALTTNDLFNNGNYCAVALRKDENDWRTFAAFGLIGKTEEAIRRLRDWDSDDARFYSAVASWISGDDDNAIKGLSRITSAHSQNLLDLIRKPKIDVLCQLHWHRSGPQDILSPALRNDKFAIRNISFHPDDLPNRPYSSIHEYYPEKKPPDFYITSMLEWHLVPPDLPEIPCPTFAETSDYDAHIHNVYPWLRLFDEIIVTDHDEWNIVSHLVKAPVSTFPKSFGIDSSLPSLSSTSNREIDFFFSGTVFHPYNPDKAKLTHESHENTQYQLPYSQWFFIKRPVLRVAF